MRNVGQPMSLVGQGGSQAATAELCRWTPHIMKYIMFAVLGVSLMGCSTPNPNPKATAAVYDQIKAGMSRGQVYELLGPPKSVRPAGDVEHCKIAKWGVPHDSHGWGGWKVTFSGDTVTDVSTSHATASGSASH
jgi:hypothetical protein